MPKYFLKASWQEDYQQVTKAQYIAAERAAGFRSKSGPKAVATAGFTSHGVNGKVECNIHTAAAPARKKL